MSTGLQPKEFISRCVSTPIVKIGSTIKKLSPDVFHLPINSMIHFIPESSAELGVDKTFSILRNSYKETTIYHQLELKSEIGSPVLSKVNVNNYKIQYHRGHLEIKELSNLDRSLTMSKEPIVLNYGILNKIYDYKKHPLSEYHQWYNLRMTMWERIHQIGARREHFIRFKLPQHLPAKSELNKYLGGFKVGGLSEFFTKDQFDLLELWQIVHPNIETPVSAISESDLQHVYLTFVESGSLVTIILGELVDWASEDIDTTSNILYKFFDLLVSLRTPVDLKELELETHGIEEDLPQDSAIVRLINAHGEAGNLSNAEQKGLLKLSQKFTTIKDPHGSGKTLDQMVVTEDDCKIDINNVINDSNGKVNSNLLTSSLQNYDKNYVNKVMPKDIIQMILKLQDGGIIVKDVKATKRVDVANKTIDYSVSTLPIAGESSTVKFTIPKIEDDGTFLLGGTKYRLDKQKSEMPVVKTKPNIVALSSYYGKLFIIRTDSSALNFSKWFVKVVTKEDKNTNPDGSLSEVRNGINTTKEKVPRVYSAIAENYKSFIISNQYSFFFAYSHLSHFFSDNEIKNMQENKLTPCGRDLKSKEPLGMDEIGKVYLVVNSVKADDDKFIYLGTIPNMISEDLGNGPIEYTEIEMFNKRIPVILSLMYIYGLEKTLSLLHVEYRLEPTNVRIPYSENEYIFKCKNTVYVIDITNPYRRLLIGGLRSIRDIAIRYKSTDFSSQQVYASIFTSLGLSVHHLRELRLIWDMFIDPITEGLLKATNQPTTFKELLLHASDMLIDDHMPNVNSVRYKGYERIAGMLYKELITAMRTHRTKGTSVGTTFSINPKSVLLSIQQDQTQTLIEESNPIHNLKEKESITHVGSGGRSGETMMIRDRVFSPHDYGVLSESSPDSGKIGIRAYLSADPKINSLRGTIDTTTPETANVSNVFSTSALLSPGVTHDDGKRINFISIQNSHTVGCPTYEALPYRTGYEEVLGGRVDDLFAVAADDDGVVTGLNTNYLSVEYKGGKKQNYEIGTTHGIVSGTTIPHTKVTDLVVGQKFKKLDILIFNSNFFQRSELDSSNVIYKHGAIARIAFVDNIGTLEDGCILTETFAKKLYTPICKAHSIIVDFDSVIHNLITVGTDVDPETILCTLEGFVSDELQTKDPSAIKALTKLGHNNPKAEVYGSVTDMEVVYYGNVEDMHESLQTIVTKFDNKRNKRVSTLGGDDAKTGRITSPIRVDGIKLEPNQLAIKVYIDSLLDMNAGDKLVVGHQEKSTVTKVVTTEFKTSDGQPIDMEFAYDSVLRRIVESIVIMGMATSILKAGTKEMVKHYNS
jgi:hypothetical protein